MVARVYALSAALLTLVACDRAPSAEGLPEWGAADHDRLAEARQGSGAPVPAQTAAPADRTAEMVELTWASQCVLCHGPAGAGDGPQGPMYSPPNLRDAAFQSSRSDAALRASIKNGKGRMPAFGLSDPVVDGLLAKVRGFAAP